MHTSLLKFGAVLTVGAMLTLVGFPLASAQAAATFKAGDTFTMTGDPLTDDLFVAGNSVAVDVPVAGEVFAVGKNVMLDKLSQRSIWAAGETVTVREGTAYNAFVAGSTVIIRGTIGKDAYFAGDTVTIESDAVIQGDVHIAANRIVWRGVARGNVWTAGTSLVFEGGQIGGSLTYRANEEATDLSKATIAGKVTYKQWEQPRSEGFGSFASLLWLTGTLIAGAVLLLLFKRHLVVTAEVVKGEWVRAFAVGLVGMIVLPLVMIALAVTVVGIPLAMVTLLIYMVTLLLASMVVAPLSFGLMVGDRLSWWPRFSEIGTFVLASIALMLLSILPVFGGVVASLSALLLTVPAFGAFLMLMQRSAKRAA